MSEVHVYPVPEAFAAQSHCNNDQYLEMYKRSIEDNEGFWREQGLARVEWIKPFTKVKDVDWVIPNVSTKWYEDGTLNASFNCIDRHVAAGKGDKVALIWEPDDPEEESLRITYKELLGHVSRLANAMKAMGVGKGDVVTIYMPMVPEAIYAMQACARIGAIHSVVFGGFSPDALAVRINDCDSKCLVTADQGRRGKKPIPLKTNADKAADMCPGLKNMIVVKATGGDVPMKEGRDLWYHDVVDGASDDCAPEEMNAEDPLLILYTSGSTGTPKGAMHGTGGYCVYTSLTFQYVFDYKDDDVFWCTADIGWITGHSYVNYGPMLNGATQVIFEGVPNYPDAGRFWEVCDKHQVSIFYTAPTAIRSLMGAGNEFVTRSSRSSLRLLGSVGEPINPEAWEWYYRARRRGRSSASSPRCSIRKARRSRARATARWSLPGPGRARSAPSTRTTNGSWTPTSRPSRASTSPPTAAAAMPTATTGSPAASMTCLTCRATAWARRKWKARWSPIRTWRRPPPSAIRTMSRGRVSTAT
jgi:acetyl-CoA synthetase